MSMPTIASHMFAGVGFANKNTTSNKVIIIPTKHTNFEGLIVFSCLITISMIMAVITRIPPSNTPKAAAVTI